MKISTKGRYGIRLMVALLKHYGEGPVFFKRINAKLEKIMDSTSLAGLCKLR